MGRVLTVVFLLGIGGLIALWLALMYKPSWYRPAILDEAGCQRARNQAVTVADDVSDRMVERRMFDVVLRDRPVNEWLAALPHVWPDARDVLPRRISDPAVGFDGGEVRIGAHYAADNWQVIIGVGLSVRVSEDGNSIEMALNGASGGALPVPRTVLKQFLDQILQSVQVEHNDAIEGTETLVAALREIRSVDELFEGVKIPNRFIWFNGDRPFRIESIKIDDGMLQLRIEPL